MSLEARIVAVLEAIGLDMKGAIALASSKVDKVSGKQLSTEDFTSAEKTKLSGIAAGAQVNTVTSVAGRTGAVVLAKADVGLGSVDNTADSAKPVSTAQQTALNLKANLASPALTGTPTAPTAADGTSSTQLATTAFVQGAVGGYLSKSTTGGTITLTTAEASNPVIAISGALTSNVILEIPSATRRIYSISNGTTGAYTLTVKHVGLTPSISVAQGKRQLVYTNGTGAYDAITDFESVALTGTPTAPTAGSTTNTTQIATTAFVQAVNSADTGSAATAVTLKTARTINGTSFNGSANITTANWGTARNLTIGSTAKSVNGSANVAWTLAEIGLGNVNNTSDAAKPVSTAQATAINAKLTSDSASIAGFISNSDEMYMRRATDEKLFGIANKTTSSNQIFTANVTAPQFVCTGPSSTGFTKQGTYDAGGGLIASRVLTVDGVDNQTAFALLQPGVKSYWRFGVASVNFHMLNTGTGESPGGWAATSDNRVKYDARVIEGALDKVDQLTGYTYLRQDMFNMDGTIPRRAGLIAQDVLKVLPETLNIPANYDAVKNQGDLLTLSQDGITALLVNAVKELRQEVNALKEQLKK